MKKLFILRHGRTEEASAADNRRTLSESGITDTREVAKVLVKREVKIDKVYTSAIRRCEATAQILAETIKFPHAEVEQMHEDYHSSPEEMLKFVQQLDDGLDTVLLVNHNSPLTHFVELLADKTLEMIHPSCMAEVEFAVEKWADLEAGKGTLIEIIHPSFDHY